MQLRILLGNGRILVKKVGETMVKRLLLLALLLVGMAGFADEIPIKVGSYNIRLETADKGTDNAWPNRKADLVALVRGLDLDVFGMQEVCPGQAKYFREQLPDWEFVGDHREADRVSGEASPVFYRKSRFEALDRGTFWLSETPEVPASKSWGTACTRVCSYLILRDRKTDRKFCFANTHTDHVSAEAREKGMLLVIERMKTFGAGAPIIFTGDHNCRENDKPALAVSRILKNALLVSETDPKGSWRTFNGWAWRAREVPASEALKESVAVRNARSGSPDGDKVDGRHRVEDYGARIDYIYVSSGVRVLDYATINTPRPGRELYPSDHFPVTATVVLP